MSETKESVLWLTYMLNGNISLQNEKKNHTKPSMYDQRRDGKWLLRKLLYLLTSNALFVWIFGRVANIAAFISAFMLHKQLKSILTQNVIKRNIKTKWIIK